MQVSHSRYQRDYIRSQLAILESATKDKYYFNSSGELYKSHYKIFQIFKSPIGLCDYHNKLIIVWDRELAEYLDKKITELNLDLEVYLD